jgi:hypothetical protein
MLNCKLSKNICLEKIISVVQKIMTLPTDVNTGYSQKNGAVSNVNKKPISHLKRVKRTPSTAATVQVSHVLPAVRFS